MPIGILLFFVYMRVVVSYCAGYDCVEVGISAGCAWADGSCCEDKKNSVVVDAIMLNIYVDMLLGEVFGEFLAPHCGDGHCGLRIEVEGDHNR